MNRSLHVVEIDIFQVPNRPCRPWQERIADYYLSGRPRFDWERLRQKALMEGDTRAERVCEPCGMNVVGGLEGCKIRVESLTSFLGMLSHLRPETTLVRYSFTDDLLSVSETDDLNRELEAVNTGLVGATWPVAQPFDAGVPRPDPNGYRPHEFYEWEGTEADTFVYSNPGYTVCLARDGIVLKESLGQARPERFLRLWKDGVSVFGETVGRRTIGFLPVEDRLPSWDESPSFTQSELRFVELAVLEIYADVIETLLVFSKIAVQNGAGLKITQVG